MLQEEVKQLRYQYPDHKLATIISYDIVNNFTTESIVSYLEKTYKVSIPDKEIHGDLSWYGRGSVLLTDQDFDKIPTDWQASLSECFGELEFLEEEMEE